MINIANFLGSSKLILLSHAIEMMGEIVIDFEKNYATDPDLKNAMIDVLIEILENHKDKAQ